MIVSKAASFVVKSRDADGRYAVTGQRQIGRIDQEYRLQGLHDAASNPA
jgi:hypothetical protein